MDQRLKNHLLSILSKERKFYLIGFTLLILSNLLLILNPLLFRVVQPYFEKGINEQYTLLTLSFFSFGLLSITLIANLLKYKMRDYFLTLGAAAERDLKTTLFKKIQKQKEPFFDKNKTGDLINLLTHDLKLYRDMLHFGLFAPLNFISLMVPAIIALAYISPSLMLISMIPAFIIPPLMWSIMQWIYKLTKRRQEEMGKMSDLIHESYLGIPLIKAYRKEKAFQEPLKYFSKQLYYFSLRLNVLESSFFPLLVTVVRLTTFTLALTASYMTLQTNDFLAFMWIQSNLFFPVLLLSWALPMMEKGRAAYDRLYTLWNQKEDEEIGGTIPLKDAPNIKITNLSFSYEKPAIDNLSLYIPKNTSVGITGPLGAGKSTLLKLLSGQYPLEKGMITLNEIDINDILTEESIGIIEQNPFLFSQTVLENIRLGKTDATEDEIEKVIRESELYETILSFPKNNQTIIGERGVTLSGGERKRLALARTLLTKRPLLLFDDLLSALDVDTEGKIFKSILNHAKEKTLLLVTHKVKLLMQLDLIIYMQKGKIIEKGSPDDLLKIEDGHFRALYYLQEELIQDV
ncbi:ABC transporter ATP-binding protein/permease [Chlamydiales bacterium]|nr:ABC transporter ATP-binding protein/permease [Chlamydiales bacterium]